MILAFDGLHKDLEPLWNVNLMGAILLLSKNADVSGPLWWNVEFVGFSDGACEMSHNRMISCGTGGVLMENKRKLLFSFSGNTSVNSPLETEKKAILFLHAHFKLSGFSKCSLHLYSDSMVLAQAILKVRVGINLESPVFIGEDWNNLVNDNSTNVSYVSRDYLSGTDKMAKNEKCMDILVFAWC